MTTPLARQIVTLAKAKNMSLSTLGRKAGVKDYTIRNILSGQSRIPNAEVLQAIAGILDCSIEELLINQEFFRELDPSQSKEELRNKDYQPSGLLLEVVNFVNNKIVEKKKTVTISQVLASIEEIYLHSLQKDPNKVDQTFADWFIGLMKK